MLTQIYQWKCSLKNTSPLRIGDDDHFVLNQFGYPFIPGTSLAGACRSFATTICTKEEIAMLFGDQTTRNRNARLIISDGQSNERPISEVRTGIRIDGATKANADGALFTRHMVAPGSTFEVTLTLQTTKASLEQYKTIIEKILQALQSGIIRLGAYKSIGSGKFSISTCKVVHYDCTDEADLHAYVNESKPFQQVTIQETFSMSRNVQIKIKGRTASALLIGGQYPNDHTQPDETFMTTPDGRALIPASSLKGVLRHRVTRIANVLNLKNKETVITNLFGTDESANKSKVGFLRLEDIILTNKKTKIYPRTAINPFTGGTKDGALLSEETVVGTFETILHYQIKDETAQASLALLLFALRDLALQKVSLGSGAAIGRGYLHIETITLQDENNEITFHFDTKEIKGNKQWLTQLKDALMRVQQ